MGAMTLRQPFMRTLLCSVTGMCVGIVGDLFGPEPFDIGAVLLAILGSPIVIPFGRTFPDSSTATLVFLLGGLAFFPVYFLLVCLCLRKPTACRYMAVVLWCAQGYFRAMHRLHYLPTA